MNKDNLFKIPGKSLFCVETNIYHSFQLTVTHLILTETENTTCWLKYTKNLI